MSPPAVPPTEPAEEPSASARLIISAAPLKGELHAQVPARETSNMINMVGRIITAVALTLGAPATVLYLAPAAGLDPTQVAALIAGIYLIAAVWLWRCHSSFRTTAQRRPPRSRRN